MCAAARETAFLAGLFSAREARRVKRIAGLGCMRVGGVSGYQEGDEESRGRGDAEGSERTSN
jgi:hypothetical protein